MTEGQGGAGGAGAGELPGGDGGAGGAGGGAVQTPEWLTALPDDLKGDATLSRYTNLEALARGHLETKRLASSKLAVPEADAPPEAWESVFDALGRPKDVTGYGSLGFEPLPADAGDDAKAARESMVKEYSEHFLQAGLLPRQAEALAKADVARIEKAQSEYYAKGQAEIDALKGELGAGYEAKKAAAQAVFKSLGFDEKFADELDNKVGSGALLRGFMNLAERVGEHGRVDGDSGVNLNGVSPVAAQEQINALFKDDGWRAKYNSGDAEAVGKYNRLLAAAKGNAAKAA